MLPLIHTTVSWVRHRFEALPDPRWRSVPVDDSDAIAATLRATGLARLGPVLSPAVVSRFRTETDRLLDAAPEQPHAYRCVKPSLLEQPWLIRLALDPRILAAVSAYFRRPIMIAKLLLDRMQPHDPLETGSWQWHHDAVGPYIKAMWLLTDLDADGHKMSYIPRSHRAWRNPRTYEESRFSDAAARTLGTPVDCTGTAGSVTLFDTNGIHRGYRTQGPPRDVLWVGYSTGRKVEPMDPAVLNLPNLTAEQREILARSVRV